MGRKRTGAGQLVYVLAAWLMLFGFWSCTPETKKSASLKEVPDPTLQEKPDEEKSPWELWQEARRLFLLGELQASLEKNQMVLDRTGERPPADRALFYMGLISLHGKNSGRDPEKALAYYDRVAGRFPESPLAEEAKIWAALLSQDRELGEKRRLLEKEVVDLTQENVRLIQENSRWLKAMEENRKEEKEDKKKTQPERDPLLAAKKLLEQGYYEASLEESQKVLAAASEDPVKDRALFLIGLIHAYPGNPKRNLEKSLSMFQRLLKEYPKSPLASEAKAWIAVLQENQKLNQMIQKSKEVDIAIEEKKREKGK